MVIITSAEGDVNMVISFTDQELQPSEIGAYKDVRWLRSKKNHPRCPVGRRWRPAVNGKKRWLYKLISGTATQQI